MSKKASRPAILFFTLLGLITKILPAQQPGDTFFGSPLIHEIRMSFWQPAYWDSLTANYPLDLYMKGILEIDGQILDTVGIKFKGNSSYNNPSDKKPFKLDLNLYQATGQIDGLKKLNLNNIFKDPSFLREKIALDFFQRSGIAAPRCAYANVYINGSLWGLYTVIEEIDKTFLQSRFNDNDGNLFKGDPSGDLKWMGTLPQSYFNKYELHTNETLNDWSDLVNLINIINNSGSQFHNRIDSILDVSGFLKSWAGTSLFSNLDSYIGSGHNYFLYHDSTLKKFRWILWDVNESFGNFSMGLTPFALNNLSFDYINNPSIRPLCNNLKNDPIYHQELAVAMCQLIQSGFGLIEMTSYVDSLANAIRPHVYADPKKTYSNQQFEDNILNDIQISSPLGQTTMLGIKSFLQLKKNALDQQLAGVNCASGALDVKVSNKPYVFPNPTTDEVWVKTEKNSQLTLFDLTGKKLKQWTCNESCKISLLGLKPGLYLIRDQWGGTQKISLAEKNED